MNDEKRRILQMLSQGKITVDEAAGLLHALEPKSSADAAVPPTDDAGKPRRAARWLRLTVDKNTESGRKKEVNLRLPAALVRAGIRLGSLVPWVDSPKVIAGTRGHFAEIDPKQLDELLDHMGEMTIDIEDCKSQVRIWCE